MTTEIILLTIAGGILPDAIRIVKTKDQPRPTYFTSGFFYLGLVLQIGVAFLANYLLPPDTQVHAVLTAYAAPNILSSLAAQHEKSQTQDKGVTTSSAVKKLRTFWRN